MLQAQAAVLTADEWRAVYREVGGLSLAPPLSAHYPGDRDVAELHIDLSAYDIVQRLSHWDALLDKRRRMLFAQRLSGWGAVAPRLRLGGHAAYLPTLAAVAASSDIAVHIVLGHAERSGFTAIFGNGWLVAHEFWMLAPHAALRGDVELGRTARTRGGPWVIYFAARLDVGYRIVRSRNDLGIHNEELMEPRIAAELLSAHGPLLIGYSIGGQSMFASLPIRRVFTHELRLGWRWTQRVTPRSP